MFGINIKKVKKLNLPLMSLVNKSRTQTAFTVSIESKKEYQLEYQLMIEQRQLRLQLNHLLVKKI